MRQRTRMTPECGRVQAVCQHEGMVRNDNPVLILTGAPGSGKTTVARLLTAQEIRAVHVESDCFFHFIKSGYVEPWKPESHGQNETIMRIVGDAAADPAADGREDMLGLVAVDLDQPLVADAEVVCDLVQHNVPDLLAEQFRVMSGGAFERATVDRDLVRQRPAVVTAPSRERHALVETEQSLTRRRLVFDHDFDVRDPFAKIGRQRVERVLDQALEVRQRVLRIAFLHLREPSPAGARGAAARCWAARWRCGVRFVA